MSENNTIKFLLNLEGENIIIDKNISHITTKEDGMTTKNLFFKTTTDFLICPFCGQIVNNLHDYRTVRMTHGIMGKEKTILHIKKKRFKCNDCNKIFTEELPFLSKNCFISDETKRSIADSLTNISSLKTICENHNVSHSTVYRVLQKVPNPKAKSYLPEVLSFDEFRANTGEGKYAFIAVDPIGKKIIEILGDRRHITVFNFFSQFPRKIRNKVKYIISDLWKPYRKIAQILFPNAVMVADKFHYQRVVSEALNKVRKRIYSKLDDKTSYQVKKHWRLTTQKIL